MQIQGIDTQVFPLVEIWPQFVGYYVDKNFNVYSTRRGNGARRLTGSGSTWVRTFTLNNSQVSLNSIKKRCGNHKDFKTETATSKADLITIVPRLESNTRSHAGSASQGIGQRGYVLCQVAMHDGVEHLLFSSKPAIHLTIESADSELVRLANSKPGTKFVMLKVVKGAMAGGLTFL